jgi:hypothetical protein
VAPTWKTLLRIGRSTVTPALLTGTDPDPQPGDLDAELELLEESAFECHEGDPSASLMVVVAGEDASRLARIADARGQQPSQVLAELLRDADRPAA